MPSPFLRRPDHSAAGPILARLAGLQEACGQPDIDQIVAGARFAFANLVRARANPSRRTPCTPGSSGTATQPGRCTRPS